MKRIRNFTSAIIALALVSSVSVGAVYAEDQKPATEAPAAAAPAAAPAAAAPAPPAVTGSATMGVLNRYIFRGYELSSHSVVFQPQLSLSYVGFSATLWSNIDGNQHATQSFAPSSTGSKSFNETDLTLSYTYNINKLALTGGYIYYGTQYTHQTEELFVSGTYDMIAHPTLAIYRDIEHNPGTYFNLSVSQSIPVYKMADGDVTVDLGASAGYEAGSGNIWNTYSTTTHAYTGGKYSAFHDGMVKAGFTVPVTTKFSVQPFAQYWFPLSGDASKIVTDRRAPNGSGLADFNPMGHLDQTFVYGLNLNFNF